MAKWIGFDLDGTLARYGQWEGIEVIGEPIEPIVELAKEYIKSGYAIRIVTARAEDPEAIPFIQDWCSLNGLGRPPVTQKKDFGMVKCYDDRAVQVVPNTGETVQQQLEDLRLEYQKVSAAYEELKWRMEGLEK